MLFTLFGALLGIIATGVVISPVVLLILLLGPLPIPAGHPIMLFLIVFLVTYAFAVISGYLYHFLLWLISSLVGGGQRARHTWIWALSLVYLIGVVLYFIFVVPVLVLLLMPTTIVIPASIGIALTVLLPGAILHFLVVLVVYLLADSSSSTTPGGSTPGESAWRGFLIGMNAVANGFLAFTVFGAVFYYLLTVFGIGIAIGVGIAAFVLSLFATIIPTGVGWIDATLKFVIGWTSWLLPMSWPTVTLGWFLFLVNVVSHLLSVRINPWWGLFAIDDGIVHIPTGTCMTEGGFASNARFDGTTLGATNAYDLGTFSYQHARLSSTTALGITTAITITGASRLSGIGAGTYRTHLHESGHNLNLAALGSWFHVFNAIDENIFWYDPTIGTFVANRGSGAYAEKLAESNRASSTGTSFPWILFW